MRSRELRRLLEETCVTLFRGEPERVSLTSSGLRYKPRLLEWWSISILVSCVVHLTVTCAELQFQRTRWSQFSRSIDSLAHCIEWLC